MLLFFLKNYYFSCIYRTLILHFNCCGLLPRTSNRGTFLNFFNGKGNGCSLTVARSCFLSLHSVESGQEKPLLAG